ncbi:Phox-like protein [Patellaria atrata CBS 101060]|uniref:Sorting nexin-4 n=1 Tax=Patellaria atrata CBS 101060 TaxID=1346257 RepID=A0A9P4S4Y0_9PEZI|nr:Phox-like protein [Patellaria atrata CBS 101060]
METLANPQDFGDGRLECTVDSPMKENEGTKDAYISYLVTTETDFKTFARPKTSVRRRFTDFVFLYKTLTREYPAVAVPPLPDKYSMDSYVRGQRFDTDFTQRRAHSLHRFLKRLTLHPVLRRAALLLVFLESSDWNMTMKSRAHRVSSLSESPGATGTSGGVLDTLTDTFLNAFSKVHKPDKRFLEVRDRANKLIDDLLLVEKVVARVSRRQSDLESDLSDLSVQFQKLVTLEPAIESSLTAFAASVDSTAHGYRCLRDATDQDYLTSLKDMGAYTTSFGTLLKTREQKQLDFEALTDYLARAASDRDSLASSHGAGLGASGFLRQKIEDVRGVDHEQSRRDRVRKLELQIERLTAEVESAKKTSEAFDEQVVKEFSDFERIKAAELRSTKSKLAEEHKKFFENVVEIWEGYLRDMGRDGVDIS